jgi:hypothetical protein
MLGNRIKNNGINYKNLNSRIYTLDPGRLNGLGRSRLDELQQCELPQLLGHHREH